MTTISIDAARVKLMLTELRLPGIKAVWASSLSSPTRKAGLRTRQPRQVLTLIDAALALTQIAAQ